MSNQARRKEKQRLKRKQRQRELRRAAAESPYKRIGTHGRVEAAYVNADWREKGMAMILFIRTNPEGGHALAGFQLDTWCSGLKGAWGRLDFMRDELDDYLADSRKRWDGTLVRIDPEEARRLVSAAVRFAHRNGFRLPERYERWVSVLGGLVHVADEDLSQFGKDGKLCWIGPINDLRQRLIAQSVDEFLSRSDVEFIVEPDDEFFPDDEFDEADDGDEERDDLIEQLIDLRLQRIDLLAQVLASSVEQRIREAGQQPPPAVLDAARLLTAKTSLERGESRPDDDPVGIAEREAANIVLHKLIGTPDSPRCSEELRQSLDIVSSIVEQLTAEYGADGNPQATTRMVGDMIARAAELRQQPAQS